eukprot:gene30368-37571_t
MIPIQIDSAWKGTSDCRNCGIRDMGTHMYEIWLAMNIAYEMVFGLLPALAPLHEPPQDEVTWLIRPGSVLSAQLVVDALVGAPHHPQHQGHESACRHLGVDGQAGGFGGFAQVEQEADDVVRDGRDRQAMPMDGVSGATKSPGEHTLSFPLSKDGLDKLPAGQYNLLVEVSREAGGREVVKVPLTWPLKPAQVASTKDSSMKPSKLLLAAALAGLALNAYAHKPWLLPSSSLVDAKEPWVTVDAAISEGLFDIDHVPLKLDAIVVTGPDGARHL